MADITAVRGAIDVPENSAEAILMTARLLLGEIFRLNDLSTENVISVIFTATADLNAVYPALAARDMGINDAALMCMQEMAVPGSLERCLRVMVLIKTEIPQNKVKHVYLGAARALRPDLLINNPILSEEE